QPLHLGRTFDSERSRSRQRRFLRRSVETGMYRRFLHVRLFPVALACLMLGGCSPPQVLDDEECFSTVDALWTAVTARSPELLDQTAADLQHLRDDGRLSAEGHAALAKIIGQARAGEWEPAAKRLKTFIQGQRRKVEQPA